MTLMPQFVLLLISAFCLISCSSNNESSGDAAPVSTGAQNWGTMTDSNNPFVFKKEDVQTGSDGAVTSGKRSAFDQKISSAFVQASDGQASYLEKDYQMKKWSGSKGYDTGSYRVKNYSKSGKKSLFSGKSSSEAGRLANSSQKDYRTGSYQTGSANETSRSVKAGNNAYVEERASDGWGRSPVILSEQEYRRFSMGQTRSLLGR